MSDAIKSEIPGSAPVPELYTWNKISGLYVRAKYPRKDEAGQVVIELYDPRRPDAGREITLTARQAQALSQVLNVSSFIASGPTG